MSCVLGVRGMNLLTKIKKEQVMWTECGSLPCLFLFSYSQCGILGSHSSGGSQVLPSSIP